MDPRFFTKRDKLLVIELEQKLREAGLCDGIPEVATHFDALKPLSQAGTGDLSFFHNAKYADQLDSCEASGILVSHDLAEKLPHNAAFIPVMDVHRALALAGRAFLVAPAFTASIHPSAVIDPGAKVDANVMIGPLVVIESGAEIGAGTRILSHSHIGAGVVIGQDCMIDPNQTPAAQSARRA